MGTFVQDLRYAARTLARSPGFTIAAIVILALGIGANTAIFSLMDAVVLHPLPAVARPHALVDVGGQTASYPWYRSVRDATATSFEGLAAWRQREMSLSSGDAPSRVRGVVVSGNYFDVLGARPAAGRLLAPADETSGEALVVLGQGLWRSRFGSDPAIAGKTIQLNGSPFTVVGVAPAGLRGTGFGVAPDLWVPIGAWPHLATGEFRTLDLERRGWGWLTVFGRLKPGVSLAQAQASLDLAVQQEAAAFPDGDPGTEKRTLEPTLRNAAGFGQSGNPVGFLAMLVGAAGVALAIACANLANLLLARAAARRKEIAVRQALGASRGRLVRQLLTESVALGILGGAAGLVVASWSIGLITRMPLPGDFSFAVFAPALDARALGFSLLLSIGTGLAFGLIPALQTSGHAVSATLKSSGASVAPRSTARGALLVTQLSLCLLLLVGAGLLGRSLQSALAIDVGFQPRGLTLASVNLGLQRYESSPGGCVPAGPPAARRRRSWRARRHLGRAGTDGRRRVGGDLLDRWTFRVADGKASGSRHQPRRRRFLSDDGDPSGRRPRVRRSARSCRLGARGGRQRVDGQTLLARRGRGGPPHPGRRRRAHGRRREP